MAGLERGRLEKLIERSLTNNVQFYSAKRAYDCRIQVEASKSNLVGQKVALSQKVQSLERKLATMESLLSKKTDSLQHAIRVTTPIPTPRHHQTHFL